MKQLEFPFVRDFEKNEFGTYGTCYECKRWSKLTIRTENTAGPLAGRCGVVYSCAFCGAEVSFMGKHY